MCQVCNKPGHTALKCYHWFDFAYQASSSNYHQAHISMAQNHVDPSWYPDTAATHHLMSNVNNLTRHTDEYTSTDQIHVDNGAGLPIHHISAFKIPSSKSLLLNQLLYVPLIEKILVSIRKFTQNNNIFFEFHPTFFFCVCEGSQYGDNYTAGTK